MSNKLPPDMTVTTVVLTTNEEWGPRARTLLHKVDLSDLREPYLSLVKEIRGIWEFERGAIGGDEARRMNIPKPQSG